MKENELSGYLQMMRGKQPTLEKKEGKAMKPSAVSPAWAVRQHNRTDDYGKFLFIDAFSK